MHPATMIPSLFENPGPEAPRSEVRQSLAQSLTSRRGLLKGLFVLTLAAATASLDMLPRIGRQASAVPATRSDCDYPSTWTNCNPAAASVSSAFCDGTGYHRIDADATTCQTRDYVRDWRCGPIPGGGNYNAWVWRKAWGTPDGNPDVRCSDGLMYSTTKAACGPIETYTTKTTCKVLL